MVIYVVISLSRLVVDSLGLQRNMYSPQSTKASRSWPLCQRTEALSDMRNIFKVGWTLVSLLWIQAEDKTS